MAIQEYVDILIRARSDASKVFGETEKSCKALIDASKGLAKEFESIVVVGGLVATAITVVVGAAVALTKATANTGDALNDLSKKTGAAVEDLSTLRLAAEQCGTTLEGLGGGLKFLSKNMVEAVQKGGESADWFKKLGVNVQFADGTMRPVMSVFRDLSDRLKELPDGAEKTAAMMALMGRSGQDLIPIMNEGSEGISKMQAVAREAGNQWSTKDAKAADALNDSIAELWARFRGTGETIGKFFIPVLREVTDQMNRSYGAAQKMAGNAGSFFSWLTGGDIDVEETAIAKVGKKTKQLGEALDEVNKKKNDQSKKDTENAKKQADADISFQSSMRVFIGEFEAGKTKIQEEEEKKREKLRKDAERDEKEYWKVAKEEAKEAYDDQTVGMKEAHRVKEQTLKRAHEAEQDARKAAAEQLGQSIETYVEGEKEKLSATKDALRAKREMEDEARREAKEKLKQELDEQLDFIREADTATIDAARAAMEQRLDVMRLAHDKELDGYKDSLDAKHDALERALDDEIDARNEAIDAQQESLEDGIKAEIESQYQAELDAIDPMDVSIQRKRQLRAEAEDKKKDREKGIGETVRDKIKELKETAKKEAEAKKEALKAQQKQDGDLLEAKKKALKQQEEEQSDSDKRALDQARHNLQSALDHIRENNARRLAEDDTFRIKQVRREEDLQLELEEKRLQGWERYRRDMARHATEAAEDFRDSFQPVQDALDAEGRAIDARSRDWNDYWTGIQAGARTTAIALGTVAVSANTAVDEMNATASAAARLATETTRARSELARLTGANFQAKADMESKTSEMVAFANKASGVSAGVPRGTRYGESFADFERLGGTGPYGGHVSDFQGRFIGYTGQPPASSGSSPAPAPAPAPTPSPAPTWGGSPTGTWGGSPTGRWGGSGKASPDVLQLVLDGRVLGELLFEMSQNGRLQISRGAVK